MYSLRVDTAVIEEDLEALKEYSPWFEKEAKRHDHKFFQAVALRANAVANRLGGKYKPALEQLEKAEVIFQEFETNWQLGRTHYEFGQLYALQNDSKNAVSHFDSAIQFFDGMGAKPDLEKTEAALKSISQ